MRVVRRHAVDVLYRDGETAVLLEEGLVRLGELSSVIYELCGAPVALDTLAAALERRFGPPVQGPPLDATTSAVAAMLDAGVLEQAR